jgi:hypothetical protein
MPFPKTSELFSGGISTPFRGNAQGGVQMLYGDEYVKKAIEVLVSDCDSDNPFQRGLGIALDNIFQIKGDARWQGRTRAQIVQLFTNYFEPANIARLINVEFQDLGVGGVASEGEVTVVVNFIAIESNTRQQVQVGSAISNNPSTAAALAGGLGGGL